MKKWDTKTLVTLSLLIAIQVVLSRFCSIAAWNVKIGFGFAPIAVAGILFGPLAGALVGGLSDFIGAILFPIGAYFPGFTLTAVLTGGVYGLFLHKRRGAMPILGAVAVTQLLLSLCLNTLWISVLYGSPYLQLFLTRILQVLILAPVEFVIIGGLMRVLARYSGVTTGFRG
mgnify:CR=1 FL=1